MKVGGFRDKTNNFNPGTRKKVYPMGFTDQRASQNIWTFPLITPRYYQLPVWQQYNLGCKNIMLSMPRRHGKDLTSTSIAVDYALRNPHASVVLLAPTKAWGRRIWWEKGQRFKITDPITGHVRDLGGSLLDVCIPEKCRKSTNNTDAKIILHNGSTIQVYGSDEGAFVGMKINFLVVSEMAQHKPEVFPLLSPILEESNGVTIYNGTVTDENNHFWRMLRNVKEMQLDDSDFFSHYLTIEDTKTAYWISDIDATSGKREININPELKDKINPKTGARYTNINRRLKLGEDKAFLIREYLNIPTFTEKGSYYDVNIKYATEENRISDLHTWEPKFPVCTAWDIGHSDKTCITFFQILDDGDHIKVIDYYENSKEEPIHYIDVIRSKPYRYKAHFAPHDISQRKWGMQMSALDLCREKHNFVFLKIPRSKSTVEDINIVRSYLSKCHFNKSTTVDLVNALLKYHENPNTEKPQHDEYSHGADSFRYMILSIHKGLIPPHDLMGNNVETRGTFKKQKMPGNVSNISSNKMINGGFPTNVSVMEDFFPDQNTWLGDM